MTKRGKDQMSEKVIHAIQDDYADDYAWCYGCGRLNKEGYHLRTGWNGEQTVTMYQPRPEHMAIPGFVFGGLIASVIDCHVTGSASMGLSLTTSYAPGEW